MGNGRLLYWWYRYNVQNIISKIKLFVLCKTGGGKVFIYQKK